MAALGDVSVRYSAYMATNMTTDTELLTLSAAAETLGVAESDLFEQIRAAALEAERPTARD